MLIDYRTFEVSVTFLVACLVSEILKEISHLPSFLLIRPFVNDVRTRVDCIKRTVNCLNLN